jgi:hypothetical protein
MLDIGDAAQIKPERVAKSIADYLGHRIGTVVSTSDAHWDYLIQFPDGRVGGIYGFHEDQLVKYKWKL